jgi:hypothetical protein
MSADVVIAIVFSLEVLLFGLAVAVLIAREVRDGGAEARPTSAIVSAAKARPRVTARARRAIRGARP